MRWQGCPSDRDGDKDGDSPVAVFGRGRSRFSSRWAPAARTGKAERVLLHETLAASL